MDIEFRSLNARLQGISHVVIKLGTGVLTPHIEKQDNYFEKLAQQVHVIQSMKKNVIIVSSGAVGFGRRLYSPPSDDIVTRQALASLGQSMLIETWRRAFLTQNRHVAQILISRADLHSKVHYHNLRNTLNRLFEWNCVPVINENDAVATSELKFGDNDTLSAAIAAMYSRSLLILLTTAPGFIYEGNVVGHLKSIGDNQMNAAGPPARGGTGGMRTKLVAGRRILKCGQIMNISPGDNIEIIEDILKGHNVGTWVYDPTAESQGSAVKRWLAHYRHPEAVLTIDDGAKNAILKRSASLLMVGVLQVQGDFEKGDTIEVVDVHGEVIARGLAHIGKAQALESLAKKDRGVEVIHRNNLIFMDNL